MAPPSSPPTPSNSLFSAFLPLLPLMLAVFIGYIAMGMALPVLPRHVHDTLGHGTLLVGVVMGAQFISSIVLGRQWAGSVTDARGPKVAIPAGLLGACGVGGLYFVSLAFVAVDTSLAFDHSQIGGGLGEAA